MTNESGDPASRKLRFDGTVTAGNLLTAVAMGLALVGWGFRLEGRVDLAEQRQFQYETRLKETTDQTRIIEGEIKQALRDVSAKLDRMLERLAPIREQR